MNFVDDADIPLEQHADENEASAEDTQENEDNNEETRRERGKDRSYTQTHAFSNVDEFQSSEIYLVVLGHCRPLLQLEKTLAC